MLKTTTYKVVRMYLNGKHRSRAVTTGLTIEEAQAICRDPESSSKTCVKYTNRVRTRNRGAWFCGFEAE